MQKFIELWQRFLKSKNITKVLIIAVLLVISWLTFSNVSKNSAQKPQYQTARAEIGTLISSISTSGHALTSNLVNIASNASGVVKKVYVKDGEQVTVGQKIAEVNLDRAGQQKNAQAWSSYLLAKNSLDSASATSYTLQSDMFSKWDTFKKIAESSTYQNSDGSPRYEQRALPQFHIAEKDWLAAEAKFKNQQAVIDQTKASINNTWLSYELSSPTITSPIAGNVGSLTIVEGMVLSAQSTSTTDSTSSQRVAVVQNETNPLITVNLTEIDVQKVKVNQKTTISLDSVQDKTFTGKVVTVDRIGTTTNNVTNYQCIIQLDTNSLDILPNMAINANIILETKTDVLLVPITAIQTQGTQSTVRVLKNGQEQQVTIQTGLSSDTQTEISSGLTEGEEVITGIIPNNTTTQRSGASVFGGGGFGGGAFRPGGVGGNRSRP